MRIFGLEGEAIMNSVYIVGRELDVKEKQAWYNTPDTSLYF